MSATIATTARPFARFARLALLGVITLTTPVAIAVADSEGVPPEDCNGNGIPDDIEVLEGLSPDVNGNLIPDVCELGAQVSQIHWVTATGEPVEAFSDWGHLDLHMPPDLADLLFPQEDGSLAGWFNVQLSVNGGPMQWAVHNFPLQVMSPEDLGGRLPVRLPIDLGIQEGQPAFGGDMILSITPQPMPFPPEFGLQLAQFPIQPREILVGGFASLDPPTSGSTAQSGPWQHPATEFVVVDGQLISILCPPFEISIPENEASSVDEEENGCAPGGVARSLAYLKDLCPDLNLPDDAQEIYEDLRDAMGTSVGEDGTGTHLGPDAPDGSRGILGGKADYLEAQGLTGIIVTTTSSDFADVAHCLADGADVELGVWWGLDADGDSMGGHMAWVVSMQAIKLPDGTIIGWIVEIVDDAVQGDGVSENAKTALVFDADGGLLGYGADAGVITFVVEKKVDAVPGDANGDGVVDFMDIVDLLSAWGGCSGDCPADLNGDGIVGFADLLEVLSYFK